MKCFQGENTKDCGCLKPASAHSALVQPWARTPHWGGQTALYSACTKASAQEDRDRVWQVRDAQEWLALGATLSDQEEVV